MSYGIHERKSTACSSHFALQSAGSLWVSPSTHISQPFQVSLSFMSYVWCWNLDDFNFLFCHGTSRWATGEKYDDTKNVNFLLCSLITWGICAWLYRCVLTTCAGVIKWVVAKYNQILKDIDLPTLEHRPSSLGARKGHIGCFPLNMTQMCKQLAK